MSRIILDLQNEKDVLLILALAERLSATIVEISPQIQRMPLAAYDPIAPVSNYNKTAFLQALQRAQQKKVFKNITNAVHWQQTLRNEWADFVIPLGILRITFFVIPLGILPHGFPTE
jgi:hypothetical protein